MINIEQEFKNLPMSVIKAYKGLTEEQQLFFYEAYKKKHKSPTTALICALFGVYHIYFGQWAKFFLFAITFGSLGIWWVYLIVTSANTAKESNEQAAMDALKDIKILHN